jgi:hypothetical protein
LRSSQPEAASALQFLDAATNVPQGNEGEPGKAIRGIATKFRQPVVVNPEAFFLEFGILTRIQG